MVVVAVGLGLGAKFHYHCNGLYFKKRFILVISQMLLIILVYLKFICIIL